MTRSLVGGVVLNILVTSLISYTVNMASWLHHPAPNMPANATVAATLSLLIYAALTLWLGRRSLKRFEVTGGVAGDDLLAAGSNVMPQALTGWLRCQSKGARRNLFRKEVCLLRPVWLLSLVAAVCWGSLALLRLLLMHNSAKAFQIIVISMAMVCTLIICILAGSLSLGEEKTARTHAWHISLPVSPFLQWSIKLCCALSTGFVGAWLLPLLITGRFLNGSSRVFEDLHFGSNWLMVTLTMTFAAFWCACAVDGTVAAVLWVIPVVCVLGSAAYFAQELATATLTPFWGPKPFAGSGTNAWLVSVSQSRQMLNLFGNLRFDWWAESVTYRHLDVLAILENPIFYVAIAGVPALILALVQSYRLFRTQVQGGTRRVMQSLLPLIFLVFVCGFLFTAFDAFWWRAASEVKILNGATGRAIELSLSTEAKLHPAWPVQLTGDDVVKAWPIPVEKSVRGWLAGARVTVMPDKAHPAGFFCDTNTVRSTTCYFSATVQLADGTNIFLSFDPPTGEKFHWGHSSISVQWPGAEGQETLLER
jgi:hypothetical protein